ncbi:type-1 restriction enzyme mjaxp r protein [Perilla frutescens var. hirtella]|uniref:Type-1 restriction enzyme mjaxp r protein n=1 Tax=Perilla frutescens var. hirtella TaxID=608512 RepID=A0AAD4PFQ6_PERFH|nr:type-1 restriction enzyme mjaxp r protein [Perilla frutescens var. hirtella]KAH6838283.1 type-1 restriction enzyme mjaxp r protein [Perilla frutescens var. hirtella]
MVTQSWFRNLWTTSKKNEFHTEKAKIAVLAFEASSLMTKLLHLWQSLTDKQVARLREEINQSVGVKKLVSESDDYIGKLICAEMTENLVHVARALARLSKKCNDPLLRSFEQAFNDLIEVGSDTYGWQFSWKKMEKKVKKMERFIVANSNLYQEMETLADLEQALKRMKFNDNADSITLVEYEKKIAWKRQEVKHLKETSLWSRTYDYAILILARSLFTIYGRIGHVFGVNHIADMGIKDSKFVDISNNRRSHSTVFMQSSVYPSENYVPRFSTGAQGKSISSSGPLLRTNNAGNFHSGPLRNSMATSSPVSGKYNGGGYYSGPLSSSTAKPGPTSKANKSSLRLWQFRGKSHKAEKISPSGPLTGSVVGGNDSQTSNTFSTSGDIHSGVMSGSNNATVKVQVYGNSSDGNLAIVASKSKLLNPPPETLGASALALHYANLIIFIEKLVASPHLIGNDARDDLYNMLPASIRASLRAKLKPYAKILNSSVYDTALANEWNDAMSKTLEWLAPLAHNMIRWQSERSFEHQNLVSRTNVVLVQTLYFAKQEKTEAEITELLVGLNYIWRFGREINAKSLAECGSGRTFDEYQE